MTITVRCAAGEDDLFGVFKLCVHMHRETVYSRYRLNPQKCIEQIQQWASSALLVVAVRDAEVVGFMAATRRPLWFSDDVVGGEDILYVHPDARGTRAALLLGRAFVEWGREQSDLADLRAGVTTGQVGSGGERLYEHLGMRDVGANYVLELKRS